MVLNDFFGAKCPWLPAPPNKVGGVKREEQKTSVAEGREGRLGEMPSKGQKRKWDEVEEGTIGPDGKPIPDRILCSG